jgi:WD40 repeat protein
MCGQGLWSCVLDGADFSDLKFEHHSESSFLRMALSHDERTIGTCGQDGQLRLFNSSSMDLIATIRTDETSDIRMSSDHIFLTQKHDQNISSQLIVSMTDSLLSNSFRGEFRINSDQDTKRKPSNFIKRSQGHTVLLDKSICIGIYASKVCPTESSNYLMFCGHVFAKSLKSQRSSDLVLFKNNGQVEKKVKEFK